jgi:hypothetical protein
VRGQWVELGFFRPDIVFNGHIFELTGFKDVDTFLAFNEFRVFIASDDTHAWMPAEYQEEFKRLLRDLKKGDTSAAGA